LTALFSTPLETRNGGIYAYQLKEGKDPLMIAEQEYESGTKLKFTNFTSCIGVVAKHGPVLTGVPLVMLGSNGGRDYVPFSPTDVSRVMTVLCQNPTAAADRITLFGFIDAWRNGDNGEELKIVTLKLTGELKLKVGNGGVDYYYEVKEDRNATYSAKIVNGEIKITKKIDV